MDFNTPNVSLVSHECHHQSQDFSRKVPQTTTQIYDTYLYKATYNRNEEHERHPAGTRPNLTDYLGTHCP